MRSTVIFSFMASLGVALACGGADAEQVVLTSQKPYWSVGVRDQALSRECALGRFNLRRSDRLVARFVGKDGAETIGVARGPGSNLYDPGHLAKAREEYYFRAQNTTSCEVFVGGRKGGGKAP
jgi:hypothetical protein